MTATLNERLNQIMPIITSDAFLTSKGIGNEIACYIFDYPASDELSVRHHIDWMMERFGSHYRDLRVLHLNLLTVIVDYLKQRELFEKVLKMERTKGSDSVLKALRGPLTAEKIRDLIKNTYSPSDYHIVLVSGVGSIWPMMRVHGLLNSLHTVMNQTPLVLFYPGVYDGMTLKLFDRISANAQSPDTKNYYRAFPLIPREMQS